MLCRAPLGAYDQICLVMNASVVTPWSDACDGVTSTISLTRCIRSGCDLYCQLNSLCKVGIVVCTVTFTPLYPFRPARGI
jgi:hypothetical protein